MSSQVGGAGIEKRRYRIEGMDCAEEVTVLRRELGGLAGGADKLSFDVLKGEMTVSWAAGAVRDSELIAAVGKTGMKATLLLPVLASNPEPVSFWGRWGRSFMTSASGLLTAMGFGSHVLASGGVLAALGSEGMGNATGAPLVARVLYSAAILAGLYLVLPKALFALRRMRPDMNLLMVIAVSGAVFIGEWFEAATVSFLFALSLTLEAWSVGRARRAIEKLLSLAPQTVRVRGEDGALRETPAEEVPPGSVFEVRPGERIGLDGNVEGGISDVNQAPITGESVAVTKEPGSVVFAGTVNGGGVLTVRSTKASGDTTLANIVRLVGEAQQKRAPSEQWVDRFAAKYTPAVMVLALLVAIVPIYFLGEAPERWIYQALVLLVIACPCALVISTPVSIVAGLAAAAKNGVLLKGGLFLEEAGRLRAVALDKTGTLTMGRPAVKEVVVKSGHTEQEVLERAAAMEAHSDHPLAQAIVRYCEQRGIAPLRAESFEVIPGKGARAVWQGREYWLGSHRYLEERGQETPEVHEELEGFAAQGRTVVVIGTAEHVCGYITLADEIRPQTRGTIAELRALGIANVTMLTGDNAGTAEVMGKESGIDSIRAELLPEDKVTAIEELVREYQFVAMAGDGINDAPALSRASIGIAMGAAGSDTALEAADAALMSDDLAKLPWLIRHSRRTMRVIQVNIIISLAVKALFVILTLTGHASLWAAIAADMGVSLLVIANALRLLKV